MHTSLDAPIGIIGQPNKITWTIQNLIYAKVRYGAKKRVITKSVFQFINGLEYEHITITFYGVGKQITKSYQLYLLEVQKKPPPQPILEKQNNPVLKAGLDIKENTPIIHPLISLSPPIAEIIPSKPKLTTLNIQLIALDFTELYLLLQETYLEQDIQLLTNKINYDERFLPQPIRRPYHEIIMESRWF